MKQKEITDKDKLELVSRQEGHFFDKKAKEIDGKKIQKIAVAFANADGGDFIIGIKDDGDEPDPNKRWSGADNKEYYNKVFQNILEITP
jgi:ATP-dependent DNA helicase RecG